MSKFFEALERKLQKNPALRTAKVLRDGDKNLTVLTPLGRFAFEQLVKAKAYQDSDRKRYGLTLIWNAFDKRKPAFVDVKPMTEAFKDWCEKQKVKSFANDVFASKSPFKKGERVSSEGVRYAGFETWTMDCSAYRAESQSPVQIYGPGGDKEILAPDKVRNGWYGRAKIEFYRPKIGVPVAASLTAVQIIAEGDPLAPSGDVEPIEAIEDDEPLFDDEPIFDEDFS